MESMNRFDIILLIITAGAIPALATKTKSRLKINVQIPYFADISQINPYSTGTLDEK